MPLATPTRWEIKTWKKEEGKRMTQRGTWARDLANGLPNWATKSFDNSVLKTDLPGIQPKQMPSEHKAWGPGSPDSQILINCQQWDLMSKATANNSTFAILLQYSTWYPRIRLYPTWATGSPHTSRVRPTLWSRPWSDEGLGKKCEQNTVSVVQSIICEHT